MSKYIAALERVDGKTFNGTGKKVLKSEPFDTLNDAMFYAQAMVEGRPSATIEVTIEEVDADG